MEGRFEINGVDRHFRFDGDEMLLEVLRGNGYTEVHDGCSEGHCGACAILLDGEFVNSCMVYAASAIGRSITTVQGIGTIHRPHPIQEAFVEAGAVQCGFCTPGMVLATYSLLQKNPDPSEAEIKRALDGNKCRCTGYVKIIDAVKLAARRMREDG